MSYEYPDNSDDIVDSRSIIERIDALKEELFNGVSMLFTDKEEDEEGGPDDFDEAWGDKYGDITDEGMVQLRQAAEEADLGVELDELVVLLDVQREAGGGDWNYGVTLVRDSYFEQYAEELAEDIGAISRDATWPLNRIDWEAAADDLKIDYSCVDWDGVTYWVR